LPTIFECISTLEHFLRDILWTNFEPFFILNRTNSCSWTDWT
jgi:hypothetical protein